jgi:hypothetical protein
MKTAMSFAPYVTCVLVLAAGAYHQWLLTVLFLGSQSFGWAMFSKEYAAPSIKNCKPAITKSQTPTASQNPRKLPHLAHLRLHRRRLSHARPLGAWPFLTCDKPPFVFWEESMGQDRVRQSVASADLDAAGTTFGPPQGHSPWPDFDQRLTSRISSVLSH